VHHGFVGKCDAALAFTMAYILSSKSFKNRVLRSKEQGARSEEFGD
jgi:IMP cyclohydrolase